MYNNKVTKTTKGVEVVVDTVASRQDHQKYNIFQKCKKTYAYKIKPGTGSPTFIQF